MGIRRSSTRSGLQAISVRLHRLRDDLIHPVVFHRDELADRDALLLLLASSLATFALTRLYTRLARRHAWPASRVGGVRVHHMVVGFVLVLASGMVDLSLRLGDAGRDVIAALFGVGGAFILDEFALTFHLRDVYWTKEGAARSTRL